MSGYHNGSFGENSLINRAEFAKVITLIYSSTVPALYTTVLPFRDTANSAWYSPYIVYVYGNGIMTGYPDRTFRPDSPITFFEAAKVLAVIYRMKVDTNGGNWYEGSVRALADAHAIPLSITNFDQYLTRGQLADIVYRLDSGNRNQTSQRYSDLDNTGSGAIGEDCGNSRNIQVTIDSRDATPSVGGSLTYEIHVKNCGYDDERVDVSADLDAQVVYDSSSDRGSLNGSRTVQWRNLDVRSGDEQVITLQVHLLYNVRNNDRIDLNVHVRDSDNNSDSATHSVYSVGSSANSYCYYDANNKYICTNNYSNTNGCYYDANNNYICNNNADNCYNDSYGRYVCRNVTNNGCYYDSNNRYICNDDNNCDDCYYDSRGRYICRDGSRSRCTTNSHSNNNCYFDSNYNYICNNNSNGDLAITITGDSTQPEPDDVIRYTVRVRNGSSNGRPFTIRALFSPDLTFVSGSDSVQIDDHRTVVWNSVYIDGYETDELTLKLKVRTGASHGERLDVNVTATNSSGLSASETATVYVRNVSNNTNCYYDSYNNYVCNNTNSCYYDSFGHYNCNNANNCSYDNYGQYTCTNGGNLSVVLRADSNSVRIGDIVRTYITLTNNLSRDEYIDLSSSLDADLSYVSASHSTDSTSGGFIEWDRIFVRSNSTTTVTLDARVTTYARTSDQLRVNVTAVGSVDTATATEYIDVRN